MRKKWSKWRADILLLGGLTLAGCVFGLALLLPQQEGEQVQVRVAGTVVDTVPLEKNHTYEIVGADGGTNQLVIQDGQVWVAEASCPDGLCVHMGTISQRGQSIVCLPNQVVIEICGENAEAESVPKVDLTAG